MSRSPRHLGASALGLLFFALAGPVGAQAQATPASASPPIVGPPSPAPSPPPATASGRPADSVTVHFAPAEPNLVLEQAPLRRRGDKTDHEGWSVICAAGCTVEVDRARSYQVGGTYVTPAYVTLPSGPGPFTVRATPGSSRADDFGTGWLLAGAATLLLGGSTAGAMGVSGATKNTEPGSAAEVVFVSSLVTTAVGLALVVSSLAFRLGNETRVEVVRGAISSGPAAAR